MISTHDANFGIQIFIFRLVSFCFTWTHHLAGRWADKRLGWKACLWPHHYRLKVVPTGQPWTDCLTSQSSRCLLQQIACQNPARHPKSCSVDWQLAAREQLHPILMDFPLRLLYCPIHSYSRQFEPAKDYVCQQQLGKKLDIFYRKLRYLSEIRMFNLNHPA